MPTWRLLCYYFSICSQLTLFLPDPMLSIEVSKLFVSEIIAIFLFIQWLHSCAKCSPRQVPRLPWALCGRVKPKCSDITQTSVALAGEAGQQVVTRRFVHSLAVHLHPLTAICLCLCRTLTAPSFTWASKHRPSILKAFLQTFSKFSNLII